MADNCFDTDLLLHDGVSQSQRRPAALPASYVKVDERTVEDLILFAKKYGFYLNYFDLTNAVAGDWGDFMSADTAVAISFVSDWDAKNFAVYLQNIFAEIHEAGSDAAAQQKLKFVFDFIFSLAVDIDRVVKLLPSDISYANYLSVAIVSGLKSPLSLIWYYYNQFKTLVNTTSTLTDGMMPLEDITLVQDFDPASLGANWKDAAGNPLVITGDIPAITSIDNTASIKDQIGQLISHNLFTGPVNAFIDAMSKIVTSSPAYLEEVMADYPAHTPHYALFLAFLRLFRFAQDHQNEYTQQHLDFYYKQVLQLSNKDAQADFVHLIFELQKNTDTLILPEGTLFKAGKDSNKNDLFYSLTNSVSIQKADVKGLRSLYLTKKNQDTSAQLFAAPVANSEDGLGAKLLSPDNSWVTFGNPAKISQANVGFAIASNLLYLNEGERTITFSVNAQALPQTVTRAKVTDVFSVQFIGSKKWIDAAGGNYISDSVFEFTATALSISITLKGNTPAIVPYSAKIHGGSYPQALPMIMLTLKPERYDLYQQIKTFDISNFTIDVDVAAVKNLVLQNDNGRIDSSKPFKPFGEFPDIGASFIIGSKEVFQKPLTSLSLQMNLQDPTTADPVLPYYLSQGNWMPDSSSPAVSPQNTNASISFGSYMGKIPVSPPDFTANEAFTVSSTDGFVKVVLDDSNYSVATYLAKVQTEIANNKVTVAPVSAGSTTYSITPSAQLASPPPSPVAVGVSLGYHAQSVLFTESASDLQKRTDFFFHVEPFGFREIHPLLLGTTPQSLVQPQPADDNAVNFLPVFNLDNGVFNAEDISTPSSPDNGGELWIGLENALPDQSFSILFQLADGTANPLKNITTISWYYLSGNNWIPFLPADLLDQTNSMTTSAIVSVHIPADATIDNTRADAGLVWLKMVAAHDTDAVCKLLAVDSNAAKAEFVQDVGKNILYSQPIPANTISKAAVANASVKKIQQPYPSFDGFEKESDDKYYTRVCERLRHKHRAITAWDYERLVLEQFPKIYKVKCLNHTGFIIDVPHNTKKYSETLAGHVTVVTIPDLTLINPENKLLPYTSIGLLQDIQDFLYTYNSPQVQLHVCNPQFEQVQFDFKVKYNDTNNYDAVLNDAIVNFLSPWAYDTGDSDEIKFGNVIEKSVVLSFIEKQSYVDFVSCFNMFQYIPADNNTVQKTEVEEAVPSTARSILVSYYDETTKVKHIINSPENCDCNG